ncbi:MAG: hypothetical protein V4732_19080 [Pseudomonadota bacterium]
MSKNTISSLLALISLSVFIVYAFFKVDGLIKLYESSNLSFQSKMEKQIELVRAGDDLNREKLVNLMEMAVSRELEYGIIKKQHSFLLFLLFMFAMSTFGLIMIDFIRKGIVGNFQK